VLAHINPYWHENVADLAAMYIEPAPPSCPCPVTTTEEFILTPPDHDEDRELVFAQILHAFEEKKNKRGTSNAQFDRDILALREKYLGPYDNKWAHVRSPIDKRLTKGERMRMKRFAPSYGPTS
jgi:hypothetical protein